MAITIPTADASTTRERTPAGIYRMKLIRMEDATNDKDGNPMRLDKNGNPVKRAMWVFEIEDIINGGDECEDFIGKEHFEWTTLSRHVKANMRIWTEALLNRAVTDDEPLSDAELVGKRAIVTVGPVTNPQTGAVSIKVSGMAPFKRRGNAQQTEVEAEMEADKDLPF